MSLENKIDEYINPERLNREYKKQLLSLDSSSLIVTKDILIEQSSTNSEQILLAKKGLILTEKQKERLLQERFFEIDNHISLKESINSEIIFEHVLEINSKLLTLGYNFNEEQKLIEEIVSNLHFDPKTNEKLTLLEKKLPSKFDNSLSLAVLSTMIKKKYTSSLNELTEIFTSALFSRIGELYIEPIPKTNFLSQSEINRVYSIPIISNLVLKNSQTNFSNNILNTVLCHCELLDGSGYPRKLSEKNFNSSLSNIIPEDAKIISLVRTYHSQLRKNKSSTDAIQFLKQYSFTHIDEKKQVVLPKYAFRYLEDLINFNSKLNSSSEKNEDKFKELTLELQNYVEKKYKYLTVASQISENLPNQIQNKKLIIETINNTLKYSISCGFLAANGINADFFQKENLDRETYLEIQNKILPSLFMYLKILSSAIGKADTLNLNFSSLKEIYSLEEDLRTIMNQYKTIH